MSISSQKVAKATITFDDRSNEAAIVIKDKDVFPAGFKYVLRPDSKHANMIRAHFVGETPDGIDWERIANNAYLDAKRDVNAHHKLFLGVDETTSKTPVNLELGQLDTKVINLQEFSTSIMEIFLKRQFLEAAGHHQVVKVNMFSKTVKKLTRTGARDVEYDDLDRFLCNIDTPALVSIMHREEYRGSGLNGVSYDTFAYQAGIKNKLQDLIFNHSTNKFLTFLTPYQPFGMPTTNICSTENDDSRYRVGDDRGLTKTIHIPSDFITVPDRSSIQRLL